MAMKKALKFFFIFLAAVAAIYVVLVIIRMFHFYNLDKTNEQVVKIHNTKLTMDDVIGKNLPPDPGAEADKTIQGIDTNKNGIRDDVELAIFKAYPDSAKTRAVLLQYALALQMEAVQKVVNVGVVGEIANKQDRAFFCVAKIIPGDGESSVFVAIEKYGKFISDKQFNTEERKTAHKHFYSYLKSGRIDDSISCDIELLSLAD
ncbi:MAG: hypothetical protein A3J73_03925 [Planctomycetes bacterium RIFCSPHIGHO2_02_FULL_38_41]|nr:MAG: hypothetical protein A3J73_03925 [Planctomycetes bacterium RIFCSPHIGHO2_02_FULL_38_41]